MPQAKRSTAIPFTATRISKLKATAERQTYNDSRREGKLRIVTSKQGVRFFYMGKDSRITMSDVSEISPEEAWQQADQWSKLEKEGFKVTRKSIQNLAKVASLTGEATELTMVKALRQRTERQFASGKMRDITRDGWLRICNQAENEEVNLFLIPVESITGEMVIDWFTEFCDDKGKPTANKWSAAFQTAYSDLLTLKVLKGDNPFKVLSSLKLTSKTNTDKNPVKPDQLGKFICCLVDCAPPEKFTVQKFLMFFLLHTGLRPDVLYRAKIEDFDFENKMLAIPRHKTSGDDTSTVIPVSEYVVDMVQRFTHGRTEGKLLSTKPTLLSYLKKLEESFGKRHKAKDMRSTHATLALSIGLPEYCVKKLQLRSLNGDVFFSNYAEINDEVLANAAEAISNELERLPILYESEQEIPEGSKLLGINTM